MSVDLSHVDNVLDLIKSDWTKNYIKLFLEKLLEEIDFLERNISDNDIVSGRCSSYEQLTWIEDETMSDTMSMIFPVFQFQPEQEKKEFLKALKEKIQKELTS